MKHSLENPNATCTGQLLGLDQENTLSITHSFPFPSSSNEDETEDSAQYQLDMMRCLREANVDHNTVGWYQCVPKDGGWWNANLIETQWNYQKTLGDKCVMLVYGNA